MIAHRLYVGTIGAGTFRSLDGGATFRRACENMFVAISAKFVPWRGHPPSSGRPAHFSHLDSYFRLLP